LYLNIEGNYVVNLFIFKVIKMNTQEIIEMDSKYVMQTYGRHKIALVKGKDTTVWDADGNSYIDCVAGIAVNNIGHSNPKVGEAICNQVKKLIHTSNLYYTEEQVTLAKLLVEVSPHQKAFFCNSGAEANEGAIKLARKHSGKGEIITMKNSFHGRTITTITATGQPKYQKGFGPLTPGFKYVPYGDIEAVKEMISSNTAAVLVEPVQGESGVKVPPTGYLKHLKEVCEDSNVLLIFDEVQTGFGRTGEMFASQTFGVTPDITSLAKAIAGGFPMGAVLANDNVAESFVPGDHAATFGGSPLGCAAAKASINFILEEKLLDKSKENGSYFVEKLLELQKKHEIIKEVRGKGLMIGVEMNTDCGCMVDNLFKEGIIVNCAAGNVLRFVPPLTITKEQIDTVTVALNNVLSRY
jgi:acetylornithine/N-succinyldiaminopimelate aminotransferase